jgi:hypothetical protein
MPDNLIPITRTFYVQRTPLVVHNMAFYADHTQQPDYLLTFYEPFTVPFGEFVPLADAFPFHNAALAQEAADRLQTANYYAATRGQCSHYAYTVYRTIARAQWPKLALDDARQISA